MISFIKFCDVGRHILDGQFQDNKYINIYMIILKNIFIYNASLNKSQLYIET